MRSWSRYKSHYAAVNVGPTVHYHYRVTGAVFRLGLVVRTGQLPLVYSLVEEFLNDIKKWKRLG